MVTAPYIPLFEIARGGMGAVHLGVRRQEGFERLYAIKRLRGHAADDADIRRMFVEEARIAGLLRHPNAVSVVDAGSDEEGPFLVMEWIDGVPLHRFIKLAAKEGPLPIGLSCRIVGQVARGLHAAHELTTNKGEPLPLVHRDVSPSNILVGFDGTVRVTDFGIAKAIGGSNTTGQGILKGKFGYMSPEQLSFRKVDRRSDLFSLGIVLFEMLTARRLYGGDSIEVTAGRILREEPPSISEHRRDAPPELEELLFELLAKSPDARPPTAKEVSERLEQIDRDVDDGVSLEDFVAGRFAEDQRRIAEKIARALEVIPTSTSSSMAAPIPAPVAIPVQKRSSTLWLGLGAVALTLAAVWGVAALGSGETITEDPVARPQVETDLPVQAAAPPVPVLPPDSPSSAAATPAPEGAVDEDEAPAERAPRPRMRRTMRGASMSTMRIVSRPGEGGWH